MTYNEITDLLNQGEIKKVTIALAQIEYSEDWEEFLLDKLEEMPNLEAATNWLKGLIEDYYRLP